VSVYEDDLMSMRGLRGWSQALRGVKGGRDTRMCRETTNDLTC